MRVFAKTEGHIEFLKSDYESNALWDRISTMLKVLTEDEYECEIRDDGITIAIDYVYGGKMEEFGSPIFAVVEQNELEEFFAWKKQQELQDEEVVIKAPLKAYKKNVTKKSIIRIHDVDEEDAFVSEVLDTEHE